MESSATILQRYQVPGFVFLDATLKRRHYFYVDYFFMISLFLFG